MRTKLTVPDSTLNHQLSFPVSPVGAKRGTMISVTSILGSVFFLFFSSLRQYKTNLPMYKVYETCKANETPCGRFVRIDRIVMLLDSVDAVPRWRGARGIGDLR